MSQYLLAPADLEVRKAALRARLVEYRADADMWRGALAAAQQEVRALHATPFSMHLLSIHRLRIRSRRVRLPY